MKSTDRSKEIAESFGCKVLIVEPALIVEETLLQKILLAKNNWILSIDPDNRIPTETWRKILSVIKLDKYDLIVFFLRNNVLNKWIRHGHGSQCISHRLFKKDFFLRHGNPQTEIHSMIINNMKSGRIYFMPKKYFIDHYAYSDIEKMLEQHLRYAKYEAKELVKNGNKSTLLGSFYLAIKKFLGDLIFRKGILDGTIGIIYSATIAIMILQREFIVISARRGKKSNSNRN
jgi:hypothetical protein